MQFVMKAIAGGAKSEKLLAFISDFRWTERSLGNRVVKCKRELASSEETLQVRQDLAIFFLT